MLNIEKPNYSPEGRYIINVEEVVEKIIKNTSTPTLQVQRLSNLH